MSDADEEFRNSKPPKTKELPSQPSDSFMDLDFGYLDPSWPFDQIPTSPVLISTSDQPFSPLWAFADGGGGGDGGSVAASDGGYRISSNGARIVSCNPENPGDEDDKKRVPSSLSGFTPIDSFDVSFIIKERMTQALRYLKESTEHQQILAQVWAPVRNGNRYVLTTSRQPFVFDPHSNGLHQYRTVSLMYMFSVDGESDGTLGLPGRVFRQKLPEWTPDVQYYSSKEYRRVNHAKIYNVRGTLALPVFEPTGLSCVGVLELIMTSQKIHYAPEVDKVCKALEAVNLKSSDILDYPNAQICNEGRQNALAEILEVLNDVCETYKLPLAQTWVPCRHRSVLTYGGGLKKSCSSFDGSCMGQVCMSTTDVAFYVVDAHMWGFREACAEHHLQKAQGVAGRAFLSHSLCFCTDIRRFCKNDYPLVHYARLFGLTSTFAVCLRSEHTGNDDYVLEFFLPPNMTDINELHSLLDDILAEMKQHFQSLMVASGRALEEERENMEIIELPIDESEPSLSTSLPLLETLNGGLSALPSTSQPQLMVEIDAKNGDRSVSAVEGSRDGICLENKETKKNPARKRGKAEKQISLDVLQQYFAGSLKDAAKSLGVCPTTMKRICRQHGISRWPSRKINKVNRSLSKLKRVIESVQGADGAFTLTSLAPSSVPVAVSSISWPAGLNPSNQQESPTSKPTELLDEKPEFPTSKSPGTDGPSDDDHVPHQNGSREASTGTSTSHGSCHGSPGTESTPPNGAPSHKQVENSNSNSTNFTFRCNGDVHLSAVYSMPDALLATHSHEPFGAVLIEDVGSSKDLRNLCTAAAEANIDEVVPEPGCKVTVPSLSSPFPCREEMKTVTIKAMFRDDIIRFRFSLSSNIVELKEEVAKRLKLEVGTFEIKYLDDDHEWVLIACDSDLYECLEISRSSRSNTIRLLIQDMLGNLGSSCESSGE